VDMYNVYTMYYPSTSIPRTFPAILPPVGCILQLSTELNLPPNSALAGLWTLLVLLCAMFCLLSAYISTALSSNSVYDSEAAYSREICIRGETHSCASVHLRSVRGKAVEHIRKFKVSRDHGASMGHLQNKMQFSRLNW
jgi:hypothetical protein